MKIRNGFVSNSSSSSFCIAKCYMSETQIEKFSKWVETCNEAASEGYIYNETLYFVGTIDHWSGVEDFLDALGVDKKFISITD